MDVRDQRRFAEAVAFALAAHAGQTRKGVATPYVSHLLQVSGLVLENSGDTTQAIAALLHDAIEDCDEVDEASLRSRFGNEVAEIVAACSDTLPGDRAGAKSPWEDRKSRYLERIAQSGPRIRLVVACDKLHNLRSLVGDLRADGLATFARFNATAEQTRWYYERAHALTCDTLGQASRAEFDGWLASLQAFVPHPEARPHRGE